MEQTQLAKNVYLVVARHNEIAIAGSAMSAAANSSGWSIPGQRPESW
jgi:hypothetical protein